MYDQNDLNLQTLTSWIFFNNYNTDWKQKDHNKFTKLLENIYRSVNIGLINEMKTISDKFKINIYEFIIMIYSLPKTRIFK